MIGSMELEQDGKLWNVTVEGNIATYSWAKSATAKWQEQSNEFKVGKNIGKANETTPHQQAVVEARSKINKKIASGYKVVKATGCLDNLILKESPKSPLPMLAHSFKDQAAKILHRDAFSQRKLDGIRCIANPVTGELFSRTGEPITSMPHISKQILENSVDPQVKWLDGELYNHDLSLQEITSIVRCLNDLHPDHKMIEYHIYDCIDDGCKMDFESRNKLLSSIMSGDNLMLVDSKLHKNIQQSDVDQELQAALQENYEGVMLRLSGSKYKIDKRSSELLKVKSFDQEEFPIVSLNPEKHKDTLATFTLRLPHGATFDSTPKMSDEQKQEIWINRDKIDWTACKASVKYCGLSDDGVPKINVTVAIRYSTDG